MCWLVLVEGSPARPCRPAPSAPCPHGEREDPLCGRQCLKGPGHVCGGRGNHYGLCGEGLTCSDCNRYYLIRPSPSLHMLPPTPLLHPLLQSNLQPFLDLFLTPFPPDALAAPSWRFDVSMTWTASLPWTGGCEAQGDQWPLGEACRRLGAPRRGEASDRRQAQLAKAWRGKPRDSQGRVDGFFHIIGDVCQTSR